MKNTEVRKFLKKGEDAIEILEGLGYSYSQPANSQPKWVAPVNPVEDIAEAIKKIIAEKTVAIPATKPDPSIIPDHIKALRGRKFNVMMNRIPANSKLASYGLDHFKTDRIFEVIEVRYTANEDFCGYAVLFSFNTRPLTPEIVWLPLSACAFLQ